jgi:hypothetical protein
MMMEIKVFFEANAAMVPDPPFFGRTAGINSDGPL